MKQITNITTLVRNTVESFNQELAKYVTQYQDEGKEVEVKFSFDADRFAAMIIAYKDKEETNNEQAKA